MVNLREGQPFKFDKDKGLYGNIKGLVG